jgi:hypothetical protein
MGPLLIGILQIIAYAIVLAIVVWAIIYGLDWAGFPIPQQIQKLLWALVVVLVLIAVVALLLGGALPFPRWA